MLLQRRYCTPCQVWWIGEVSCWSCGNPTPIGGPGFAIRDPGCNNPGDPYDERHGQVRILA